MCLRPLSSYLCLYSLLILIYSCELHLTQKYVLGWLKTKTFLQWSMHLKWQVKTLTIREIFAFLKQEPAQLISNYFLYKNPYILSTYYAYSILIVCNLFNCIATINNVRQDSIMF